MVAQYVIILKDNAFVEMGMIHRMDGGSTVLFCAVLYSSLLAGWAESCRDCLALDGMDEVCTVDANDLCTLQLKGS
jgi:hypothetical protein